MIVGSLLLILVAVGLLGLGLARGSNTLLIGSIAASLLAAVTLIAWARRSAAARSAARARASGGSALVDTLTGRLDAHYLSEGDLAGSADQPDAYASRSTATAQDAAAGGLAAADEPTETFAQPTGAFVPSQSRVGVAPGAGLDESGDEFVDEDPADEPAVELASPEEIARVAGLSTEVLVIDGRPRFHLPSCVHLLGRDNEPLPVSEAVELGFTPCGLCDPVSAMISEARPI